MKHLWTRFGKWPKKARMTRRRISEGYESCESRLAMAADPVAWGAAAHLTLSFAPDGTSIAGQSSGLFAAMDQVASTANWQDQVVRAFQTWAMHTNADVGIVADGGQPFGTDGATRADSRFGDIRIGAIPMRDDVYAIAIPQDTVNGTWVGDVIFNSQAPFQNTDEIFRVALHEAGHVFGLEDNQDPNSALYSGGVIPTAGAPSPADQAELWARYGTRSDDFNDVESPNESLSRATRVRYSTTDGFNGSTPLILYGDIKDNTDVDWYRFDSLPGYTGAVTFTLRTAGVSVLRPTISIHNRNGDELATTSSLDGMGSTLTIRFEPGTGEEHFYVEVKSTAADPHAIGGYALMITLDDALQVDANTLASYTDGRLRGLTQDQIQRIFVPEPGHSAGLYNDDLHLDDDPAGAKILDPVAGFVDGVRYQALASVSDSADIDSYRITTPQGSLTGVATIRVRGIDGLSPIARVELLDSKNDVLPASIIVHQDRELVVQAAGLEANKPYVVRVIPTDSLVAKSPNYELTISLSQQPIALQELSTGVLTAAQPQVMTSWHVPTWQLVHLLLDVSTAANPLPSVEFQLRDKAGGVGVRFAVHGGDARSASPRLLPPGDYELVVISTETPTQPIPYRLLALVLSDPLAVPPSDPLFDPLVDCPGHVLCFPAATDINSDGAVDASDAGFMFAVWGSNNAIADVNGDGIVDAADAGFIFGDWTG